MYLFDLDCHCTRNIQLLYFKYFKRTRWWYVTAPYSYVAVSFHSRDPAYFRKFIFWQCCGSGAFFSPLDLGCGIRDPEWVFSGSQITNPYFWEFIDNFSGKKYYSSQWLGSKLYLHLFKNKIIINFVMFVATKKVWLIFFHPPLLLQLFVPGSRMDKSQNPGSE